MLHVFDDCAREHYERTMVGTSDSHHEHGLSHAKKKVTLNQRAGSFL